LKFGPPIPQATKADPQIAFFDNPGSNNLKHILPRKPNSDWKIPQDIMRAYYKRIGNLTIFDPKANVDIGNSSFNVKKKEYVKGSTKRRFLAVLHIPPITSPRDAVRAAIVAVHRSGKIT
jgi:hypothetical protein